MNNTQHRKLTVHPHIAFLSSSCTLQNTNEEFGQCCSWQVWQRRVLYEGPVCVWVAGPVGQETVEPCPPPRHHTPAHYLPPRHHTPVQCSAVQLIPSAVSASPLYGFNTMPGQDSLTLPCLHTNTIFRIFSFSRQLKSGEQWRIKFQWRSLAKSEV